MLVSCRYRVREDMDTVLAVSDTNIPLDVFGSESVAADLLQQVRWRDGVSSPRCRMTVRSETAAMGSFSGISVMDYGRTFNDKTGTIAHSKNVLRKWLFSICAFLRFNMSVRQLQCEIQVTYKTIYRRVEHFVEALDAPSLDLCGLVEMDEYLRLCRPERPRERDQRWHSRPRSTRAQNI